VSWSSGSTDVMFQPRRLRTCNPSSVETIARNPSHFSSKAHPDSEGSGPERDSIGSGSRSPLSIAQQRHKTETAFLARIDPLDGGLAAD
jgi:hypothetical protein